MVKRSIGVACAVLAWLTSPVLAGTFPPPAPLCAIVVASAPGSTPEAIRSYFAAARGHVYNNLHPKTRKKLVEASVAMMSMPSENKGRMAFAGENWGTTGIAHLWLLGETPEEIRAHTDPLLLETYRTRIEPGLREFQRHRDFRTPSEPFSPPRRSDEIEMVFIRNNEFVGAGSPLSEAIRTTRLRSDIDSHFSETVPGIIYYHFEGALLSGNRELAEQILEYILLLDKGSDSAINGLEALGRQSDLLALGKELLSESLTMIESGSVDFHLRNNLRSAIEALARVTDPKLKPEANTLLLKIAELTALPSLHQLVTASSDDHPEDVLYTYYDLALLALQSTGVIIERKYVDSVRVELTHKLTASQATERAMITAITDKYIKLTWRVNDLQYHEMTRALIAIGDSGRLDRYADYLFAHRQNWREEWQPTNVYGAALRFYREANNAEGAKRVVLSLLKEFEYVDRFTRENRKTIAPDDEIWELMIETAAHFKDARTLRELVSHAEALEWNGWVEEIAEIQAGEKVETSLVFPHVPQIPTGIQTALSEDLIQRERLAAVPAASESEREDLIRRGERRIANGEMEEAFELFLQARHAEGVIEIGDAYLEAHYQMGGGAAHYGAAAHGYYFIAALIEAE